MQLGSRALKKGPYQRSPQTSDGGCNEAGSRSFERKWGLDPKAAAWVKGHF